MGDKKDVKGEEENINDVTEEAALLRTASLLEVVTEDVKVNPEEEQQQQEEAEEDPLNKQVADVIKRKCIQVAIATLTAR